MIFRIKLVIFTVIFLIAESENVNSMSDIYDLNGNSKKTTEIEPPADLV